MTGLRNTSMRELGVGAKFAAVKGISQPGPRVTRH